MICRGFTGALVFALFVAAFPHDTSAQAVLPRAGQSFSFGIIEGPYSYQDSASALQQTTLTLTVVSAYSGCGIITSPSGYSQDFNFAAGTPTILNLPLDLIHLDDLGKTEKGLLVHTTEPVNLVLHDYIPYGGDATQILPDNALDTSYITCGWGIWDDPSDGENDLNEFLVTATADSTYVTITPSVNTLLGQPNNVPFLVMLNRGECYIVKADTSDHPSDPSLSGSIVHATKPVSVISGLTCAYVPVGIQACNELMDELIGRKWWGTHFFMQPLDINDPGGQLVLTSSSDFKANISGTTYTSSNGRLAIQFTGTLEIHTIDSKGNPFPVEAHQLTRSYSLCDSGTGDPSLVTILDTSYYSDTALWNTPSFEFSHCVPIICPTADLGTATLDGTPLNQWGAVATVINGSSYSAIDPQVQSGLHEIISPDPIFAISAGFFQADAYTFIAGTAGTPLPRDSIQHAVILKADSAMTCTDFTVTASLATPILSSEGVNSLTLTMTYDPSAIDLVAVIPLGLLTNATFTIDTSTPGTLTITVIGMPTITGDTLFQLIFEGLQAKIATNLGINGGATTICSDDSEIIFGEPFTLVVESGNASPLLHREDAVAYIGQLDSLTLGVNISSTINIDSLWPSITAIQAVYSWDSSIVRYAGYLAPSGWTLTSLTSNGNSANFAVQKTTAPATDPIVLGTALFTPNTTQPATSWVELPSFVIDVGSQAISLCATDNEDNHWAVKTLGASSAVALPALLPEGDGISIYPNPAGEELFVQNANAVPLSIELYDAIGRSVMTGNVLPSSTAAMDIALLAPGSYVLVCHIGDQTIVRRISKVE